MLISCIISPFVSQFFEFFFFSNFNFNFINKKIEIFTNDPFL